MSVRIREGVGLEPGDDRPRERSSSPSSSSTKTTVTTIRATIGTPSPVRGNRVSTSESRLTAAETAFQTQFKSQFDAARARVEAHLRNLDLGDDAYPRRTRRPTIGDVLRSFPTTPTLKRHNSALSEDTIEDPPQSAEPSSQTTSFSSTGTTLIVTSIPQSVTTSFSSQSSSPESIWLPHIRSEGRGYAISSSELGNALLQIRLNSPTILASPSLNEHPAFRDSVPTPALRTSHGSWRPYSDHGIDHPFQPFDGLDSNHHSLNSRIAHSNIHGRLIYAWNTAYKVIPTEMKSQSWSTHSPHRLCMDLPAVSAVEIARCILTGLGKRLTSSTKFKFKDLPDHERDRGLYHMKVRECLSHDVDVAQYEVAWATAFLRRAEAWDEAERKRWNMEREEAERLSEMMKSPLELWDGSWEVVKEESGGTRKSENENEDQNVGLGVKIDAAEETSTATDEHPVAAGGTEVIDFAASAREETSERTPASHVEADDSPKRAVQQTPRKTSAAKSLKVLWVDIRDGRDSTKNLDEIHRIAEVHDSRLGVLRRLEMPAAATRAIYRYPRHPTC